MNIITDRLLLRDFTEADAPKLIAYHSYARYLEFYAPDDREPSRVRKLLGTFISWSMERPRQRYQLAITLDEHLIGTCGVRKETPDSMEAEFGCELDPDYWGRGYAQEASRAILAFGFGTLELRRVWARVVPENTRAVRLAESLGLRRKEAGLFAILKEEWAG
ncbi:MAG: GNAT family N-acetyltransferase [Candidatus Methylomirabilales bacterium]